MSERVVLCRSSADIDPATVDEYSSPHAAWIKMEPELIMLFEQSPGCKRAWFDGELGILSFKPGYYAPPKVEPVCRDWCGKEMACGGNEECYASGGACCYCTKKCEDKALAAAAPALPFITMAAWEEYIIKQFMAACDLLKSKPTWTPPTILAVDTSPSIVAAIPDLPRDHHAPLKHLVPRWSTPRYEAPGRWHK